MKIWGAIFNLISVLIIAIMIISINKIQMANDRQFEQMRLSYAIDYATEAAFRAAISTDTIGTDYSDGGMEEVKINPTLVLPTFYNVLGLSYDLSMSDENIAFIDQSIATGFLCGVDGYYVLENVEVDNNIYDYDIGGEYKLTWGVKRPYIVYADNGTRLFSISIVNEKCTEYITKANQVGIGGALQDYSDYASTGSDLTTEKVKQAVSKLLTEDINYAIHSRNLSLTKDDKIKLFYVPSSDSLTAVNNIKSPSLAIIFQDSTFLNGYDIDAVSVGGARVRPRTNVLGFTLRGDNTKYYCYAGQQLGDFFVTGENKATLVANDFTIVERFNTIHEAATKGYSPHFMFLQEPYGE